MLADLISALSNAGVLFLLSLLLKTNKNAVYLGKIQYDQKVAWFIVLIVINILNRVFSKHGNFFSEKAYPNYNAQTLMHFVAKIDQEQREGVATWFSVLIIMCLTRMVKGVNHKNCNHSKAGNGKMYGKLPKQICPKNYISYV